MALESLALVDEIDGVPGASALHASGARHGPGEKRY